MIFAAVFPRFCSTGPLTLSHPSARLSKFKLILVLLRWGFNLYQIFFSHLDTRKYLLLFFQESVQLVPSLYHILQQGCQNSNWFLYCWDGVSTRTQIFERKWNCQNMFTQIFLSEIISIAENGGQGTHFLISQILKGLTHSALNNLLDLCTWKVWSMMALAN